MRSKFGIILFHIVISVNAIQGGVPMKKEVYLPIKELSLGELLEKGNEVILQQRAETARKMAEIFDAAKKYGLDKKETPEGQG